MNNITTHVLDLSAGRPASGIEVRLERLTDDGASWQLLGQTAADEDGRIRDWPGAPPAGTGRYRLTFAAAPHFANSFYPEVTVVFEVSDPGQHYHVPLLLSPFGYTTYRGS